MERFIDYIYVVYFASHIPIALCFDSQALFPKWLYPQQLVDVMDWYTSTYRDVMMKYRPAWFQAFIGFEMLVQFPFFFVALYAYWNGVSKNRWIRIPIIVYATNVVTSLVCIYSHVFFHEFSAKSRGPTDMTSRLQLASFYFPYFVVPVILLFDAIFHPIYVLLLNDAGKKAKKTK